MSLEHLNFNFKNPIVFLVEYFDFLKNKIDVASELYIQTKIYEIEEAYHTQNEIIHEIDRFQENCLSNFLPDLKAEIEVVKYIKASIVFAELQLNKFLKLKKLKIQRIFLPDKKFILVNNKVLLDLVESLLSRNQNQSNTEILK